ncbi:MAG TPA: tetratricopeptide repeat protein [Chloroflexota bacterium]|nr:tetratricopeptide repeat protein [Chloroflexota bacterium]
MTTFTVSAAERARQKRQLADQAVKLAMQNQWQEAVDVNRQIIDLAPEEGEAWNRMGKAFSELGRYGEARDAYNETLTRDPNNAIAQKQVRRLSLLIEASPEGEQARTKLDPRLLVEETGKTGLFELRSPAKAPVLARMTAGDEVLLKPEGNTVRVENGSGETLGLLPARAALRLIELLNGGNRYVAGVVSVAESGIRVLVRETYQAPALQGRVSFPSKGGPLPPELRAYTKDRALRFDLDEDAIGDEGDDESPDGDAETEDSTADIEYYEEGEGNSNE